MTAAAWDKPRSSTVYADFRNFITVINKAREACSRGGHTVSDHFVDITEMVSIGSSETKRLKQKTSDS